MHDIALTEAELVIITGNLTQPRRQLAELHARGFWRARLGRDSKVVLERAHYEAVCAGVLPPGEAKRDTAKPQVQPIPSKRRAA